eukprot:14137517-Alexandrium_andersonii.AAC.1
MAWSRPSAGNHTASALSPGCAARSAAPPRLSRSAAPARLGPGSWRFLQLLEDGARPLGQQHSDNS